MQGLGVSCSELVLQVWSPAGSQAVGRVAYLYLALGLCNWAVEPLIMVRTHPRFQVWAPMLLIKVCAHPGFQLWAPTPLIGVHAPPPRVSGVAAQSADLGARQPGFRCVLGLLIWLHSPGPEGVGVQEATAASENSLNSR